MFEETNETHHTNLYFWLARKYYKLMNQKVDTISNFYKGFKYKNKIKFKTFSAW